MPCAGLWKAFSLGLHENFATKNLTTAILYLFDDQNIVYIHRINLYVRFPICISEVAGFARRLERYFRWFSFATDGYLQLANRLNRPNDSCSFVISGRIHQMYHPFTV